MIEFFFLFWFLLDKKLKIYEKQKLNYNMIKIFHSISSSALSYYAIQTNDYHLENNILYSFSKTYFLWDSFKITTENIYTIHGLFHHIGSLYAMNMLYYNTFNEIILKCYYATEMSNIPLFISYHMINTNSQYKNIIKKIQILFYLYFRMYMMSIYLYESIYLENRLLLSSGIIIYLLGIKTLYDLIIKKHLNITFLKSIISKKC